MQRKNAERARELNAKHNASAAQKAAFAKIVRLVQIDRQSNGAGNITYCDTPGTTIDKIYVSMENGIDTPDCRG